MASEMKALSQGAVFLDRLTHAQWIMPSCTSDQTEIRRLLYDLDFSPQYEFRP